MSENEAISKLQLTVELTVWDRSCGAIVSVLPHCTYYPQAGLPIPVLTRPDVDQLCVLLKTTNTMPNCHQNVSINIGGLITIFLPVPDHFMPNKYYITGIKIWCEKSAPVFSGGDWTACQWLLCSGCWISCLWLLEQLEQMKWYQSNMSRRQPGCTRPVVGMIPPVYSVPRTQHCSRSAAGRLLSVGWRARAQWMPTADPLKSSTRHVSVDTLECNYFRYCYRAYFSLRTMLLQFIQFVIGSNTDKRQRMNICVSLIQAYV